MNPSLQCKTCLDVQHDELLQATQRLDAALQRHAPIQVEVTELAKVLQCVEGAGKSHTHAHVEDIPECRQGQRKARALRLRWPRCTTSRCAAVAGSNAGCPSERSATPLMIGPGMSLQQDLLRRRHHGNERLPELLFQNFHVVAVGDGLALDFLVEHVRAHRKLPLSSADVLVKPVGGPVVPSCTLVLTPVVRPHSKDLRQVHSLILVLNERGNEGLKVRPARPLVVRSTSRAYSAPQCTEGTACPRGRRGR